MYLFQQTEFKNMGKQLFSVMPPTPYPPTRHAQIHFSEITGFSRMNKNEYNLKW
uniref:Uncharacterized protein n=1 Tax=Arion vulgaris TaxID=1028688 RepID=A0A0B6Y765_9EUPU